MSGWVEEVGWEVLEDLQKRGGGWTGDYVDMREGRFGELCSGCG